ncbi:MAG: DUF1415 domain-containing protein [Gammaproteobacteria bacterium]|nr:DUF1415 domain-containing protein [Gammaproteobacteria bacterium]
MDKKSILRATRHWLEATVIGRNLCPFAKLPLARGEVRLTVSAACSPVELLLDLADELQWLDTAPDVETTLLIHPDVLQNFGHYNQFLTQAEGLLYQQGYEGIYQLASFHPDYQFAGTSADDAQNYSNRSPYAMLHLLREASVERAVAAHPDPQQIPQRNIEQLEAVGRDALHRALSQCYEVDD